MLPVSECKPLWLLLFTTFLGGHVDVQKFSLQLAEPPLLTKRSLRSILLETLLNLLSAVVANVKFCGVSKADHVLVIAIMVAEGDACLSVGIVL